MSFKKVKSIHNKEVFQRVNFLHQAAEMMAGRNDNLSCYYGNLMKQIQRKSVLKMDPSIKRDFCKRCSIVLNPQTSELSASDTVATVKCKKCGYNKNYPVNDHHQLWNEQPAAIQEVIEIDERYFNNKNPNKQ